MAAPPSDRRLAADPRRLLEHAVPPPDRCPLCRSPLVGAARGTCSNPACVARFLDLGLGGP